MTYDGTEFTLMLLAVLLGASILKFVLSGILFREVVNTAPIVKLADDTVTKLEEKYKHFPSERLGEAYSAEIDEVMARLKYADAVRPLSYAPTEKQIVSKAPKWKCSYCGRSVKFDSDECPGCGAQKD